VPPARKHPQGSLFGPLGLAFGGVIVAILGLEVGSRIAVPHWRWLTPQRFLTSTADGVLSGLPNFHGRLASLSGEFDTSVDLDGRGFANRSDADPGAPLVFFGDSFCLGWGLDREQRFADLVARGLGVPSYNFCMIAADLVDDLRIQRRWLPPGWRGTTVLSVTFENDVLAYPDPDARPGTPTDSVRGLSRSAGARWLVEHSALFNVTANLARRSATLVAMVHRLGLMSGVPVISANGIDPIQASVRVVEKIRSRAGDGPFLVVTVPPRPGQVLYVEYAQFVAALRGAGFSVIDPASEPSVRISTIPNDGHWDRRTNAAIADVIVARLRSPLASPTPTS